VVLVTLTEVLEVNWTILYFVYGLVFFVTGLVTGLQWRRGSDLELARPLPWLAAFGIAHGLNEWGYIFIPLQAVYMDDTAVRLMVVAHMLLLAVSYFFLLQFGVELMVPFWPRLRWLRAVPLLALVLWGIAVFARGAMLNDPLSTLVAVGDGWSRYFLCFPGALLASVGLFHQAREMRQMEMPRISAYLVGAGVAFAVYAVAGGLLVPPSPAFPAMYVNSDLLLRIGAIPAPVVRSVCGLAMAFCVVRSLEVFQVETELRLSEMEQAQLLAADRERIGRELHDGIIQNIYAVGLGLEDVRYLVVEDPPLAQKRLGMLMTSLNMTVDDIRRYIFDLRAAEQTREMEKVLENLVEGLRLDTFLEVDLEVVGQRCCWMDADRLAHMTQIAREALSNVVQHADANHVTVRLTYLGEFTQLAVEDDGRGLAATASARHSGQGQGIANMRERARMLGGDLAIESEPGHGSRLVLTIPCGDNKGEPVETVGQVAWD
jgi:signal transduction histidine kinase